MKFLIRLLTGDAPLEDPAARARAGKRAGIVGIACNVLLFAVKLAAGLLSGAIGVIADSLNNLADASASLVTVLGFRLAQQPADRDHPYGHARYEYLSAFIVSALILLIGAELVKSSVGQIFVPEPVDFTAVTVAVLAVSVAVKLGMFVALRGVGTSIGSGSLCAAAADSRNDALVSACILAAGLVERFTGLKIDGFVGLGVAVFILCSGYTMAKETISPLLGRQADRALVEALSNLILRHDKVQGFHDLLVHDYGPGQCFASVHVEISAEESALDCHDIIDDIEQDALRELRVNLVIHYDPVVRDDPEQERLRQLVTDVLGKVEPRLSMHDLRTMGMGREKALVFDLAVPYEMMGQREELCHRIEGLLKEGAPEYKTVIRVDGTA